MKTFGVTVRQYDAHGADVIAVEGEITVLNIGHFAEKISRAGNAPGGLVVDLRDVLYIDSAGLEQLILALTRQNDMEKPFSVLVRDGGQPDEVLHTIQFDTLAKVSSDPAEVGLEA